MLIASGLARPAVPATFIYSPQRVPAGYGLVTIGRDPQQYDRASIEAHDAAGGITGIYINPTLLNAAGKYAAILHSGSRSAPGGLNNGYGLPAVIDTALLDRLERVLNMIADDFGWLTRPMYFGDDGGPDNDRLYGSIAWSTRYDWQVAVGRVFRKVSDERGWICATNAVWDHRRNHGFPTRDQPGCELYDMHTNERHPSVTNVRDFWHLYMRDAQTNLKDSAGNNFGIHILSTVSEAQAVAQLPFSGFVTAQTNYANPGPVIGTKRNLGIPFGTTTPPPPPPPALDEPTPPVWTATAEDDGRVRIDVTPNPADEEVDEYQLYGAGIDAGKTYRAIPAGQTYIAPPLGVELTLRMSAHNAAGYGPWTPSAGVKITPRIVTPPPPPPPDPTIEELQAQIALLEEQVRDLSAEVVIGNQEIQALQQDALDLKAQVAAQVQAHGAAIGEILDAG